MAFKMISQTLEVNFKFILRFSRLVSILYSRLATEDGTSKIFGVNLEESLTSEPENLEY